MDFLNKKDKNKKSVLCFNELKSSHLVESILQMLLLRLNYWILNFNNPKLHYFFPSLFGLGLTSINGFEKNKICN